MKKLFPQLLTALAFFCLILKPIMGEGQLVTTIAGGGNGDGGSALSTSIFPGIMSADISGDIFFTDGYPYNQIKKISGGIVSTVINKKADAIATDPSGNLYFVNNNEFKIFKLTPTGELTTIAGIGTQGNSGDGGLAVNAEIGNIISIAVAATGEIFFSDNSKAICRVMELSIAFETQ